MNRTWTSLLTASLMSLTISAHAATLLVGSYTDGASQGIYRYHFDDKAGQIGPTPLQVVKSVSPSWLVLSADQRQLFAVNETPQGHASSFSISSKGEIKPLNQVVTQGDEPTHASLSRDQRYLFVANYAVNPDPGGSLVVIPVAKDGTLKPVVQQARHKASGVNPERQAGAHVHSLVLSPDGQHLYASDLGADKVFIYRYDGASADHPLTAAIPASVALPPGSGPRHLLFDAKGRHAYLTLEMNAEVVMFDVQDGNLVERQRLPLTERQEAAAKAAGGLHLSADGRFLYVSNRGTANEIVAFSVGKQDGQLTFLQRRPAEGDHPREFALDPSDNFLLVANQKSNQIVVIRRDPRSGKLLETVQTLKQDAPSDLKFIE
ncbi:MULTISPECIES: lactonase family protein [Pseudomonas]|jgi:6-phosphogluconolactonase (cycloisomerase 2 family)|uniref:L-alpha-hydroxyglutaric acid gamma-lactonase n=2 Tax=Pseudomonas putida group TaxID=136845 RepID=Q88LB4_PSEPK|nr:MULTISPECIES: lactonase family protein [Pseudomonas]AAN67635.1 L-alpha-hydroxyglutaric acid gamma-lactonase [Pseudomonas putida KT2440]MCE0865482.1 lactonase family protein [Pseudomonas alloputida]MCE0871278.1 lactonase family protein [Pseudomonas alloputida]MCE0894373.1 lactonase family protein [Pseudomonas alloputida]MCE0923648.1 lactonase family protein [Pseudomonas alloputida]